MSADDAVSEHLVRRFPPRGGAPGPCPDDNLLAAFAEGRLPEEQAALVDGHLVRCDRCRGDVALLAPAVVPSAAEAATAGSGRLVLLGSRRARLAFAAAAAILIAVGAAVWHPWSGKSPSDTDDLDARLVAAARHVPGFSPILRAERNATGSDVERGQLTLGLPAGSVRAARPAFAWLPLAGAASYDLSLVRDDGTVAWTRRASASPFSSPFDFPADAPPLADGSRWVWQVRADGPLGRVQASRSFVVAAARGETIERSLASLVSAGDLRDDIRDLVAAQVWARDGFFAEAEAAIARHLAAHPADAAGRETLAWMRRRLGVPAGGGTRLLGGDGGR